MNKKLQDKIIISASIPLLIMAWLSVILTVCHIKVSHVYLSIVGIYGAVELIGLASLIGKNYYANHHNNSTNYIPPEINQSRITKTNKDE